MKNKVHILVVIILLLQSCSKMEKMQLGDDAPGFELLDVDSIKHTLVKYSDRIILIHFWADWCSQCRAEFPRLENAYKTQKENGLQIIAINVGQTKAHVEDFKREYGLTFPMLLDPEASIAKKYGVRGLPMNYFLDKNKKIAKIVIGWVDEEQIEETIYKIK